MYFDKEQALIETLKETRKSDAEYAAQLEEIYTNMEPLQKLSYYVDKLHYKFDGEEINNWENYFDAARHSVMYMNNLFKKNGLKPIYPTGELSDIEIYKISCDYGNEVILGFPV